MLRRLSLVKHVTRGLSTGVEIISPLINLTDDQSSYYSLARAFADKEMRPYAGKLWLLRHSIHASILSCQRNVALKYLLIMMVGQWKWMGRFQRFSVLSEQMDTKTVLSIRIERSQLFAYFGIPSHRIRLDFICFIFIYIDVVELNLSIRIKILYSRQENGMKTKNSPWRRIESLQSLDSLVCAFETM